MEINDFLRKQIEKMKEYHKLILNFIQSDKIKENEFQKLINIFYEHSI